MWTVTSPAPALQRPENVEVGVVMYESATGASTVTTGDLTEGGLEPEVEAQVVARVVGLVHLDRDHVVADLQCGGRERERDRRGLVDPLGDPGEGPRRVGDRAGRHVVAGDLDPVQVDDEPVVANDVHRETDDAGEVVHLEGAAEVRRDRRRGGGRADHGGLVAVTDAELGVAGVPARDVERRASSRWCPGSRRRTCSPRWRRTGRCTGSPWSTRRARRGSRRCPRCRSRPPGSCTASWARGPSR